MCAHCTCTALCILHSIAYVVCIVLYMKWSPFPIAVAVKMSILHCCLFSSLGRQKFMRLLQKLKRGVTHWFLFVLLHYHKKWAMYTKVRNLSVLMEERKPGKIYGDMTFMVPGNNFDWLQFDCRPTHNSAPWRHEIAWMTVWAITIAVRCQLLIKVYIYDTHLWIPYIVCNDEKHPHLDLQCVHYLS